MTKPQCFIVGIGASAGGVDALTEFLRGVPQDCDMAFVIVTHLNPKRESQLHTVLARQTSLPVEIAVDDMQVKAGVVYVKPETGTLRIRGGRLKLAKLGVAERERKPIDVFFSALGEDQRENAAGVVLSGGDGDGTLGIKVIKEYGGIVFAQGGDGSKILNAEMPESAIATGLVDFVLPPCDMGERLIKVREARRKLENLLPDQTEEAVRQQQKISDLLCKQTGHSFAGYKSKTFFRRVARRMEVLQIVETDTYINRLKEDASEVSALFRHLLIGVTDFFRDTDAFAAFEKLVLPELFKNRTEEDSVRIWVPACTTGEEVFSFGILLREQIEKLENPPKVQIFATDIDERALGVARAGRYPVQLLKNVSPARRKRFFTKDGGAYVVRKEVRDMCIFSPHNVIGDPPFSRMDLVSCRNLLIYFGPELQRQVIPTLHYALKPGGYLFLGTSESISHYSDLFSVVDKKNRIFQSLNNGDRHWSPVTFLPGQPTHAHLTTTENRSATSGLHLRHRIERQIMENHTPPHVVVRRDGEIAFFSERTGRYLEMPKGAPNRQLLDMVRPELRLDVRGALREAMDTNGKVSRQSLIGGNESTQRETITLTVEPLDLSGGREQMFLVLFKENPTVIPPASDPDVKGTDPIVAVEREMIDLRERLQSTIEEYETALEELKSSNEELVSVNEEAQSTNEELEASKEEMQSLNEELTTINSELNEKIEELDRANGDLKNLFEATQSATVFLDQDLVIRSFTPAAATLFHLRPADLGRPLTELASVQSYPELQSHIEEVFASGQVYEHRLDHFENGDSFLVRLNPYLNEQGDIAGAVVSFLDVTTLTTVEGQQQFLVTELNFRVREMMSVVISMVKSTLADISDKDDVATLIGRLHSMARIYSMLSESGWTRVNLRDVLKPELVSFGAERFNLSGPTVDLDPTQATALALVVHELASNAAKHGAFANGSGSVSVVWQRDGKNLRLRWQEKQGVAVTEPKKFGSGMTLIQGQVERQLGGKINTAFHASGLGLELELPLVK